MGSQAQQPRNGSRIFFGEEETEEEIPEQHFCKEIRNFKNLSRSFHELYAQTEGAHADRWFDRDQKNILEMVVKNALHYPNRYEGKKTWSKEENAECSAIVDEILSVSEKMGRREKVKLEVVFLTMYQYSSKKTSVVSLFKVYGNSGGSTFISRNRRRYNSLHSFVDNNDLPHSLVCAAREGRTKTYEIDPVLNKYPLVFFTVNYSKYVDRSSEHRRVWSTILKNNIVLDLPFFIVQGFFENVRIEVKYFTSNVNFNDLKTTSMKYKFYKFMDKYKELIPVFGTFVNQAILFGMYFSFKNSLIADSEFQQALVLNGNLILQNGISSFLSNITCRSAFNDLGVFPHGFPNSFPGFKLGEECSFEQLINELKENILDSQTISDCSDIIRELCLLGEKVLDMFSYVLMLHGWKFTLLTLKLMLRILPYLIRNLNNKHRKPKNYIAGGEGNRFFWPDDGSYSLNDFLKATKTEKVMSELLSDKDLKSSVEHEYRECVADDSEFICISAENNLFLSLTPTFTVIEKLLENSHKNARVIASEDNSFYEISSEEALYKIYPFQIDKLNVEIQYIWVERRLSRSGQPTNLSRSGKRLEVNHGPIPGENFTTCVAEETGPRQF